MLPHPTLRHPEAAFACAIYAWLSLLTANSICSVSETIPLYTPPLSDLSVDGSDFSGLFNLFGLVFNQFIITVVCAVHLVIFSVLSFIVLRLLRRYLRKHPPADAEAAEDTRKIQVLGFWAITAATLLICLIQVAFWAKLMAVMLYLPVPLLWLLIFRRRRHKKPEADIIDITPE